MAVGFGFCRVGRFRTARPPGIAVALAVPADTFYFQEPEMRDLTAVKSALRSHQIELPSWAFGNSGTRFKVFAQPGVPRDPFEKIDDAAQVHRYTGVAPSIALHIPWDRVEDYAALAAHAKRTASARHHQRERLPGRRLQARLASRNPDPRSGARPSTTCSSASTSWTQTGSRDLKLWFSDGTNYPGQDDIRARQDRLAEALAAVYARLGEDQRLILEYKLFEPAFYTTDVPDWGTAYAHCLQLGERAQGRASTPATTRRAPTSSSSSRSCCARASSAPSTSTPASTPTTT